MGALDYAQELKLQETRAKQFGGNLEKGAAAFGAIEGRAKRRDIEATQFRKGDTFVVPATENDEHWISAPLQQGGDPVLRCNIEVTNGNVTAFKEFFLGTMLKNVRDLNGKSYKAKIVDANGAEFDPFADCVTEKEQWQKLFGKTLTMVEESAPIHYIRRAFTATQRDRESTTTVWTIQIA